ncbi:helix-turn-helix domain-containing protein [Larkinella bovis]|uniref:Helix-turn-helix domain-containing protein n=1 Tax=Larkinella bovis TaxID=683041 RepID=A0ABW0I753_9BACT
MSSTVPVYQLQTFSRSDPDTLFHMTRLEDVVKEMEGVKQPHAHNYYLIMWFEAGSGIHTIDSKPYSVAPNQLYFLPPGKIHSWEFSADTRGYNLFFDSDFCRDRSGHLLYRYPFFHDQKSTPLVEVTDPDALFDDILDFIYQEYRSEHPNRYQVILSALHIILELADRLYHQSWHGDSSYLYERIRQYEELIEHQFMTVREVSDYAAQMSLTPHYLNQICKKVIGKTASQLIQERLILEARFLLKHTFQSVKEISFQLGFQDPSYFVRFFRKNTGQTPVTFRQHLRVKR